jgi:hypothetical protein
MTAAPAPRSTSLAAICLGAAAVQLIAAAAAVTFLGKLGMVYGDVGARLPAATSVVLAGNGALVWGLLLGMALALAVAARWAGNRARSIVILAAAILSGILGILVPLIVLLPLQGMV